MKLEEMSSFFTQRVESYDEHMLMNVSGCKEGYIKLAAAIPKTTKNLLDIGCGTGLELDEIFKQLPTIKVTGIDITQAMLDKLKAKHRDKNITLICGSYFDVKLLTNHYDCAVSFQTLHHFTHEKKLSLYKHLFEALSVGGMYIECDYMVTSQEEEDFYFSENERLRMEQGIPANEFYHYDTPCTIDNQISLLTKAQFKNIEIIFQEENTVMITAVK